MPKLAKVASKSSLGPIRIQSLPAFFFVSGQSALVGFTRARLTNAQENLEGHFEFRKTFEIALVSLTLVRLTSMQENRRGRTDAARPAADTLGSIFGSEIAQHLNKYNPENYKKKRSRGNMNNTHKKGSNMKPELIPQVIKNQCQNK